MDRNYDIEIYGFDIDERGWPIFDCPEDSWFGEQDKQSVELLKSTGNW